MYLRDVPSSVSPVPVVARSTNRRYSSALTRRGCFLRETHNTSFQANPVERKRKGKKNSHRNTRCANFSHARYFGFRVLFVPTVRHRSSELIELCAFINDIAHEREWGLGEAKFVGALVKLLGMTERSFVFLA